MAVAARARAQGGVDGAQVVPLAGPLGLAEEGRERKDQVGQGRRRTDGRLADRWRAERRARRGRGPAPALVGLGLIAASRAAAGAAAIARTFRASAARVVVRASAAGEIVVGDAVVGGCAAAVALPAGAVRPAGAGLAAGPAGRSGSSGPGPSSSRASSIASASASAWGSGSSGLSRPQAIRSSGLTLLRMSR